MERLQSRLTESILKMSGVSLQTTQGKEGDFHSFRFNGKDFAHFHNDHEIDLKLTKKVIHENNLKHPTDCKQHPNRSENSPWIALQFYNLRDVNEILHWISVCLSKI